MEVSLPAYLLVPLFATHGSRPSAFYGYWLHLMGFKIYQHGVHTFALRGLRRGEDAGRKLCGDPGVE